MLPDIAAKQRLHARRRLGSEAFEARVTLEVNWQPQRFRLSPALSSLLGVQSDTRASVLQVSCSSSDSTR